MKYDDKTKSETYYMNGEKCYHWERIDNAKEYYDSKHIRRSEDCVYVYDKNNKIKKIRLCDICRPGIPGPQGPPGPPGPPGQAAQSECECCIAGLRAVLGYLFSVGAADIRVETVASQPAGNNVSITGFFPTANDASTALLVQLSNGAIVSLCEIENIQSAALIDASPDFVPDALRAALDATIAAIPPSCRNCCQEQLRTLFQSRIGTAVTNVDTNRNNVISGANNIVRATGAALALISLNNGTTGAALNLCYVSSVSF